MAKTIGPLEPTLRQPREPDKSDAIVAYFGPFYFL